MRVHLEGNCRSVLGMRFTLSSNTHSHTQFNSPKVGSCVCFPQRECLKRSMVEKDLVGISLTLSERARREVSLVTVRREGWCRGPFAWHQQAGGVSCCCSRLRPPGWDQGSRSTHAYSSSGTQANKFSVSNPTHAFHSSVWGQFGVNWENTIVKIPANAPHLEECLSCSSMTREGVNCCLA